jgi:hypothetical protein
VEEIVMRALTAGLLMTGLLFTLVGCAETKPPATPPVDSTPATQPAEQPPTDATAKPGLGGDTTAPPKEEGGGTEKPGQ